MKFGYARISTKRQSIDLQIRALKKENCDYIYQEEASSKEERHELEKLLSYAREGDTIVVWKLDRLARTMSELLNILTDLEKRRIMLKSITENIDPSTPEGKFFLHAAGMFAEYERNIIIERTNAGLEAARERGIQLGRRPGLTEEGKKTARLAANLYTKSDLHVKEICETLNISTSTFYIYLKHENIAKLNKLGRPRKDKSKGKRY